MTERRRDIIYALLRIIQSVAEYVLIAIILVSMLIAVYALWDIKFIASKAEPMQFEKYKPREDKGSYEELVKLNPDVIGWINIYGTNIDYPVVQAEDNEKYLTLDARGEYSLAGSLFLDYRNKPDFTDFNNIIHGHNMSHNVMLGDVSDFLDEEFLRTHTYGDLFFGDKHHGLKVVAIEEVDAYSSGLYGIIADSEESKTFFFEELEKSSKFSIPKEEKMPNANYVLLSTCTTEFTNGRHILVCRLTDEVYENTFAGNYVNRDTVDGPRLKIRLFLIVMAVIAILLALIYAMNRAEKKDKMRTNRGKS